MKRARNEITLIAWQRQVLAVLDPRRAGKIKEAGESAGFPGC